MANLIKKSDSLLMKIINILLIIITFGKQKRFMTGYVTTIGSKIYVPSEWDSVNFQHKDVVLFHENVHVEQYKREGFLYFLKYLFWPLPALHAHARLSYELDAYAADIVYSYRKYGTPVFADRFDKVIGQMTNHEYFWTCTNRKHVIKELSKRIFRELKKTRPL
jgi:hypothetical protein